MIFAGGNVGKLVENFPFEHECVSNPFCKAFEKHLSSKYPVEIPPNRPGESGRLFLTSQSESTNVAVVRNSSPLTTVNPDRRCPDNVDDDDEANTNCLNANTANEEEVN